MADAERDAGRRRLSRRSFITAAGLSAAGAVGVGLATRGESSPSAPPNRFPTTELARLSELKVGHVVHAAYPDAQSPVVLLKLGRRVPDGVGPDGDIVAYSSICTHMGCTVEARAAEGLLACPCHFSSFDAARGGMQVIGQATTNLPQVSLTVDGDRVLGVGMRGLIWGRQTNLQQFTQ
jgi:arsenite oxidase small subunit